MIYWPEYTSWDDDAISTVKRNRVTFMRYLTKLADQVMCLMSKEHSDAIVWNDLDPEEAGKSASKKAASHNRLYTFAVQKTKEQEETVSIHDGYQVRCFSFYYELSELRVLNAFGIAWNHRLTSLASAQRPSSISAQTGPTLILPRGSFQEKLDKPLFPA